MVQLYPICFVFKPQVLGANVRRVLPCDSGAVSNNIYDPILQPSDLPNLELDPNILSARRAVSLFFQSNTDYFVGKVSTFLSFPPDSLQARFCDLARGVSGPADDRRSAIEVQSSEKILLRDKLMFVVLPQEFFEEKDVRYTILNVWNCDAERYSTISSTRPTEYYGVIRHIVENRLRAAGRL